jgi:hypothetical protein
MENSHLARSKENSDKGTTYKILIVFKKMSVSQQKLFNYEYKIAIK